MSLRLLSVNIERSKHLERVLPFLRHERPDIVCFQELDAADLPLFRESFPNIHFVPQTRETEADGRVSVHGSAIATRSAAVRYDVAYYEGNAGTLPESNTSDPTTFTNNNGVLIISDVEEHGETYRICTTHFTWSPKGLPTDLQRKHMRRLLDILSGIPEFVLCGDFNAPRGGELFSMLTHALKDNIPPEYVWSLDLDLHRAGNGPLQKHAVEAGYEGFMVDGLFSTPGYKVSDVKLHTGVSDHCAITASIDRV